MRYYYIFIITTLVGLNSLLHAATNDTVRMENTIATCDSVVYNGITYTRDTFLYDTLKKNDTLVSIITYRIAPIINTYGYTIDTVACDSIVWRRTTYRAFDNRMLNLRIADTIRNHCQHDSIRQIHFFIYPTYQFYDSVSVQSDTGYWWNNGRLLNHSGHYVDTFKTQQHCDSIYHLSLHLRPANCPTLQSYFDTAGCDSIRWNGIPYHSTTTLNDTIEAVSGCDSIHTTTLRIYHSYTQTIDTTACHFLWYNDSSYTQSTTDTIQHLYTSLGGCDSTLLLNAHIQNDGVTFDTVNTCDSYRWHNILFDYASDTIIDHQHTPGHNPYGCDSVFNLHLILNHSYTTNDTIELCDSIAIGSMVYYAPTTIPLVSTASNLCDSTINLYLNIHATHIADTSISACDFYRWGRQTLTSTGIYTDTIGFTSDGCYDIQLLQLTIHYASPITHIDTIACDTFAWHAYKLTRDTTLTFPQTNRWHCDSNEYLTLRIHHSSSTEMAKHACPNYQWYDSVYTRSGDVVHTTKNTQNCDSTIILHLTISSSDTIDTLVTACDSLLWRGHWCYSSTTDTIVQDSFDCHIAQVYHLNIGQTTQQTFTPYGCDSIRWDSTYYYQTDSVNLNYSSLQGCDSSITLLMTIGHTTRSIQTVSECHQYTWHGTTYTQSSDSITWKRSNRSGCDSIITLHLTIYQDTTVTDTIYACQQYPWNHQILYTDTLLQAAHYYSIHGCDSFSRTILSIHQPSAPTIDIITACSTYYWHDNYYSYDTTVTDTTHDRYGCPTHSTLQLSIHPSYSRIIPKHACDSFYWETNRITYYASTTQSVVLHTQYGCDSSLTLNLVVDSTRHTPIDTSVCAYYTLPNGMQIDSNVQNFNYTVGLASNECDSLLDITLTLLNNATDSIVAGCQQVQWNHHTYITPQIFEETYTNAAGCDSVHRTHIEIDYPGSRVEALTACDSIHWRNKTYTASGTYADTIGHHIGCDSTIYLILNIDTSVRETIDAAINKPTLWNDTLLTHSGDYLIRFARPDQCDSIVLLQLKYTIIPDPTIVNYDDRLLMLNHYPYGENGTRIDYAAYRWVRNGTVVPNANSDAIAAPLNEIFYGCYYIECAIDGSLKYWLGSNIICIGDVGIPKVEHTAGLTAYPNPAPANGKELVQLPTAGTLTIYNSQGITVYTHYYPEGDHIVELPTSKGMYLLHLTGDNGMHYTTRVIKQ